MGSFTRLCVDNVKASCDHTLPSPVQFHSLQVILLIATQWPVRAPFKLLRGSPIEAPQFHSNTQSHWSSESTICFPPSGSAVRTLGMHPLSQWNQVSPVPWRLVPRPFVLVTIRPKRSSPMDRHLAPPISGSWSSGAARAVDGASLLHGPLRVDGNTETEKKLNEWTKGRGTKRQGTVSPVSAVLLREFPVPSCLLISLFPPIAGCY